MALDWPDFDSATAKVIENRIARNAIAGKFFVNLPLAQS
jgi:hypothetical protein